MEYVNAIKKGFLEGLSRVSKEADLLAQSMVQLMNYLP